MLEGYNPYVTVYRKLQVEQEESARAAAENRTNKHCSLFLL